MDLDGDLYSYALILGEKPHWSESKSHSGKIGTFENLEDQDLSDDHDEDRDEDSKVEKCPKHHRHIAHFGKYVSTNSDDDPDFNGDIESALHSKRHSKFKDRNGDVFIVQFESAECNKITEITKISCE
jgi:hypothetical protein